MRRGRGLLAAGALVLASAASAAELDLAPAPTPVVVAPEFTLLADEVIYDGDRDIYEATGNVRISQADGKTLTTDWIVFNGTTRVGVATGDVRVVDSLNTVTADFIAVDLRSTVSVAMRGQMDNPSPGFSVRGDVIQRTGVDTYRIEKGRFTTCRCPPGTNRRPWEIEVEEASIELGGYAVGKNLWFRAFDVPVFYLPWLIFPAKTERQTGFLLPSFSQSSRNGAELELPFFWAVGESLNLTLRPSWIGERGFKQGADVEYVVGETGYGYGGAAGILGGDDKVQDDESVSFSDDRWAYWLRHEQPITSGVRFGTDITRISDNQYVVDFRDLPHVTENERFIESTGWVTGARRGFYGEISAGVFDDLQSPNDLDRDGYLQQRLPDVRLSSLPRVLAEKVPLRFGFDSRYTWFRQLSAHGSQLDFGPNDGRFFDTGTDARFTGQEPDENGNFPEDPDVPGELLDVHDDDFAAGSPDARTRTEGDGIFQEGELLADSGQRIDVYPTVSLPLQFGIFELLGEGGVRETFYLPDETGNDSRTLWTGRADLRTRFGRSYALGALPLRHVIEPRIVHLSVFAPDQDENPLFIPASAERSQRLIDGDIRLLARDPTDRVADARLTQIQVSNRLYGPELVEGGPPRLYGELRLGTGWDSFLDEATRVFVESELRPSERLNFKLDAGWNPEESEMEDFRASVGWRSPVGHQLRVGYRYLREPNTIFEGFQRDDDVFDEGDDEVDRVRQLNLAFFIVASRMVELYATGFLSLEDTQTQGGRAGVILLSGCKCWDVIAEIERRTRPDDTRLNLQVRISGLGQRSRVRDVDRRKEDELDW